MKRNVIRSMAAALAAGILLTGCSNPYGAAVPAGEEKQGTDAAATKSPEEEASAGKEADTPETFDVASVYSEPEHVYTDIEGCDTFTQIVDRLEEGRGYTNTTLGDADVLLVSDGVYTWEPKEPAAIDAEVYIYRDGAPYCLGYVAAGGTAYPLQVRDGQLYVGGNHFMRKYTVRGEELVIAQEAYVSYDRDGGASYYYRTADTGFEDCDQAAAEERFDALFEELGETELLVFDRVGGTSSAGTLPPYEYPGPEAFYTVLYRYLIDTFGPHYDQADVSIPCPVIVAEDESNREDIRVYGIFWLFNYDLNGDTLENTSGGSYPGVMHLKSVDTGDGYEVVSMDVVEDGSGYTESAKKLFGEYYDAFSKAVSDDQLREETRAQIIANYVAANDLAITAYQDYGWDPVSLPEENIDSFYSILD